MTYKDWTRREPREKYSDPSFSLPSDLLLGLSWPNSNESQRAQEPVDVTHKD